MDRPVFYYDTSSPYAYLAAMRIDTLIPDAQWQPIAFGALIQEIDKVPWSLRDETRDLGIVEIERRARVRGLPPPQWPAGWPAESYSLLPLRALMHAFDTGDELGKQLTFAFYDVMFVQGSALDGLDTVAQAAAGCGIDGDELRTAIEDQQLKHRLRAATDAAIERGVTGVPTVAVGDALFWGDDALEDAAAAAARG